MRWNEGGDARGDATILKVFWGSPVRPSKLNFSTEIFKNVLKILCNMGIKRTLNFETFLTCQYVILIVCGSRICGNLWVELIWVSCAHISNVNTH